MKKINRFERLVAAADVMCRGEEERYDRKRMNLANARQQAEKLSAIGSSPNGATMLLPEIWCARLSKTFAEIARLDDELEGLAQQLRLARRRREKAEERLRGERTKERIVKEAKDVETHMEITFHANRIRLR